MILYNYKLIFILTSLIIITYQWCLHKTASYASTINTIEYSPDRAYFLTTNSQGTVILWDAANTVATAKITPPLGAPTSARFGKNNTFFGIATLVGNVYLYNLSYPFALIKTITAGTGTATTKLDFSYDATYMLVCGGANNIAKVFDLVAGTTFSTINFISAQSCKFASNNNIFISSSINNYVQYFQVDGTSIWSQTYSSCSSLQIDGPPGSISIACGVNANAVQIGTQTLTTIFASGSTLRSAQISLDSSYLAFCGDDKEITFIKKSGTSYTQQFNYTMYSEGQSSDFSSDSNYLVVGTNAGYIYEFRKYCIDCSISQYMNLTTLQCQLCSEFNRACGACINSTYCTNCIQGYYLQTILIPFTTTRICLPCLMQGCIVCNSSTVCIRCEVGYYVTATNICQSCSVPMPGCTRCNTSLICQKCTHDYYLNNNSCTVCSTITGCSLCATASYCHVCQVGYYNVSGTCTACPINCFACYSTTTCIDCRQGYYPTNTAAAACSPCPTPHCLSCNQTGYCHQCGTNTYLDSTGNCVGCTYPCNECNSTVCRNCQPGYYLDYLALGGTSPTDGGLCLICSPPCMTCNSSSFCVSCPLGYYLVTSNHTCATCSNIQSYCSECSATVCLNCSLGYFISPSNTCLACSGYIFACVTCNSTSKCLKCGPGYYITANTGNNSCQPCTEGCQLCNSSSYCYGCIDGFYLLNSNNSCIRCAPPCTLCTSSILCLSCEQKYYLNGTTCKGCQQFVPNCVTCDDQIFNSSVLCISCRIGYYLNVNSTCTDCASPCLVCSSSSACIQCQIGYYLVGTTCTLCPQNCTACTSATVCSSCTIGFYYDSSAKKCYHCSTIGCMTCNSSLSCLSCSPGYYLAANSTCILCLTSMKYCQTCSNANLCLTCSFGYTLGTGNTSCLVCSSIVGCFDCSSLTSCDVCQSGYYIDNTTGSGVCQVCPSGCSSCNGNTTCVTCLPGFVFQANSCVLCRTGMLGCQLCTSNTTCIQCSNGYFLFNSSCQYCASTMKGCYFCNSSSICTYCAQGYYLLPNNTCQLCSVTIPGCTVCTSSSVCKSCQNGYYLSGNLCHLCSSVMPFCFSCTDNTTCLDCLEGYALNSTTIQCTMCKTPMPGCVGCSSLSICEQCQAGYYLRTTDKQCVACTQTGCEVCYQTNAALCISCNTMYFLSSNQCYYCHNYLDGCIECTSSSICTLCQTGYFINSTNKCQLCQTSLEGCGRCNNSVTCYECKSTYFLNTTTNKCQTCLSALDGCAYCLDLSSCISCANGYYKNATTGFCDLCTDMVGCLACSDYNKCLVCQGDYFLSSTANKTICYPCNVILGCYSCISNTTCVVCAGGYILNDDKICEIYQVQADEPVKGMKMVSEYVNDAILSHTIYAHQMKFTIGEYPVDQWANRTDIILQHPTFFMQNLTITAVRFIKDNQLQFETNNPLSFSLEAIPSRRMLSAMPEGYKTFLKMKQDMINIILPDLYMSHSMVLDYDLSNPQFYASFYEGKLSLYQSAFGIIIILLLTINYIIKATVTYPNAAISEYAQILPHFLALKAPPFIIYPLYPEQISFCFGFMVAQFPWFRDYFASVLVDRSEYIPKQYSLFYDSLSLGTTYILAAVIGFFFLVCMWLYKKNKQTNEKKQVNDKQINEEELITKIKQHKKWGLPEWPLKIVMYNFFFFGLVFNGSASLQNAILNPLLQVNVSAVFTVFGIICFGLAFVDSLYSLSETPLYFFKLRIFSKALLLSVCHLSPIYIYSASFALDILCMIIEYRFTRQQKLYPKLWLYNNFAMNLVLAFLVIIHSHFVTLIIAGIIIGTVFLIQLYVHYQEYIVEVKKDKFILPKQFNLIQDNTEIDKNIWNINFLDKQKPEGAVDERKQIQRQPIDTMNQTKKPSRKTKKEKKTMKNLMNSLNQEESLQNLGNLISNEQVNGVQNKDHIFLAADFMS